jgi:hypothetical protein
MTNRTEAPSLRYDPVISWDVRYRFQSYKVVIPRQLQGLSSRSLSWPACSVRFEHHRRRKIEIYPCPGDPPMKQCLIVCAVLFLLLSGSTASAQIAADRRGRVLDASGAVVANATVELTNSDTNTHLITGTSAAGDYVFTNLNPGSYQLDVTASGFETPHANRHHRYCRTDGSCRPDINSWR